MTRMITKQVHMAQKNTAYPLGLSTLVGVVTVITPTSNVTGVYIGNDGSDSVSNLTGAEFQPGGLTYLYVRPSEEIYAWSGVSGQTVQLEMSFMDGA